MDPDNVWNESKSTDIERIFAGDSSLQGKSDLVIHVLDRQVWTNEAPGNKQTRVSRDT